jgi:hypothetical protein
VTRSAHIELDEVCFLITDAALRVDVLMPKFALGAEAAADAEIALMDLVERLERLIEHRDMLRKELALPPLPKVAIRRPDAINRSSGICGRRAVT